MLTDRLIAKAPPRPPSARILQATRMLSVFDYKREFYQLIDKGLAGCDACRPPGRLGCLGTNGRSVNSSCAPGRSQPVARATAGIRRCRQRQQIKYSKTPTRRDQLRDEHPTPRPLKWRAPGLPTWRGRGQIEYSVVRGISDYCTTPTSATGSRTMHPSLRRRPTRACCFQRCRLRENDGPGAVRLLPLR